jgi:hypothetical protein
MKKMIGLKQAKIPVVFQLEEEYDTEKISQKTIG